MSRFAIARDWLSAHVKRIVCPSGETPLPAWASAIPAVFFIGLLYAGRLRAGDHASWQSGRVSDTVSIFLSGEVAPLYIPFDLYSGLSLMVCHLYPTTRRFAFVRWGVYLGIFHSLFFCILLGISHFDADLQKIAVWAGLSLTVPFVAWWGWYAAGRFPGPERRNRWLLYGATLGLTVVPRRLYPKIVEGWRVWRTRRDWGTFLKMSALAALGAFFYGFWVLSILSVLILSGWLAPLLLLPMLAIYVLPLWIYAAFCFAAFDLLRSHESRPVHAVVWGCAILPGWILAYRYALQQAVARTIGIYAALPVNPPDTSCYVCTAAAGGHPRVVRSRRIVLGDGRALRANAQMRRLKCAEIVWSTVSPASHRRLRVLYDRIGPRLARRLTHPLLCDAAYLAIKPVEWAICVAMHPLLPSFEALAVRLYPLPFDPRSGTRPAAVR